MKENLIALFAMSKFMTKKAPAKHSATTPYL